MNKKLVFFITVLLWILVVAVLMASKQSIYRTGTKVLFETMPVDPRDFLRGDYVVLNYKISNLDLGLVKTDKKNYAYNDIVYVKIEPKDKFWEAIAVESVKPSKVSGLYIKGRAKYYLRGNKGLSIEYGIENYFVPEGEGRELEKKMQGVKSAVVVEALVDKNGNSVINRAYVDK